LDAINLYEQMAAMTENENIKEILLDIAKEEKTHVGEFQALLLKKDEEQAKELEEGKKEVDELTELNG
jgi:rubrerythrin